MSGARRPKLWPWTPAEDAQLRTILGAGKGTQVAAQALTRTSKAIRARAVKLRLSTASKPIVRLKAKAPKS